MMAQSWSMLDQPLLQRSHSLLLPNQPLNASVEDEDLFNVALLFLDHGEESLSDDCSDSFSVQASEDISMQEQSWSPPMQSFQDQLAEASLPMTLEPPSLKMEHGVSLGLDTSVWNPTQAKPTSPPRRVNKRRLEIQRLRVETQALQKRLTTLQEHAMEPISKSLSSTNRVLGEVLGSAWQNIAERQLEQRHRAENENQRLKNLVNEHKRMAKALRRLVARHANAKAWDPLQSRQTPASAVRAGSFDAMDDPAVYKELSSTLDTMYQQINSILSNPKLRKESSSNDVETEVDNHDNMHVQMLGSRTLPFSFNASSEAMWDYMFRHCGPKALQWEPTKCPNTFQADFVAYTEMYHFKGLGRAKMMLRRIDEADRVIILRSALFQCPGGDDATGLQRPLRHSLWKIIQKPTPAVTPNSACEIVSFDAFTPTLEVQGLDREAREAQIETLTAMCTQLSTYHTKKANEFVDNTLLRRSVESPRDVTQVIC